MSLADSVAAAVLRPRGQRGLMPRCLARRLRKLLVRWGDPLVRYRHFGFELELPLSHQLPVYRQRHPEYDTPLERLARAVGAAYPAGTVVDIGANVGDSAALVRAAAPHLAVLCVEGDPGYAALLRRNVARLPGTFAVESALVGAADGEVSGKVVTAKGTGRLDAAAGGTMPTLTLATLIARHPELPPVRLVKIDTDGFDWPVLEASAPALARLRPVLFVECDARFYPEGWDPRPLLRRLADAGYGPCVAFENTGEFHATFDLPDAAALVSVAGTLRARRGSAYLDLAVFPNGEGALASAFVASELRRLGLAP